MGRLKYLDTQKGFNVPPVEEVMKVSQEAALRRPQEGGEPLWTGERRQTGRHTTVSSRCLAPVTR